MEYELAHIHSTQPATANNSKVASKTGKTVTPRRPMQQFASRSGAIRVGASPLLAGSTADKPRTNKRQADRLLKQLPLSERRRQQQIRQLILGDPIFGGRGAVNI